MTATADATIAETRADHPPAAVRRGTAATRIRRPAGRRLWPGLLHGEECARGSLCTSCGTKLGEHGYLGAFLPEEYGGGGQGVWALAIVSEELAAAGCPMFPLVYSAAIVSNVLARHGTPEQKAEWLPRLVKRRRQDLVRHHRTRRGLQLPQNLHHRTAGRRPLGA